MDKGNRKILWVVIMSMLMFVCSFLFFVTDGTYALDKKCSYSNSENIESIYSLDDVMLKSYSESADEVNICESDDSICYEFPIDKSVDKSDVLLVHFSAIASEYCGKIKVSVNGNKYNGVFILPVYQTEYIIPISGLTNIKSICISLETQAQGMQIGNFEVINHRNGDMDNIQTGLFDCSSSKKVD